MRATLHKLADDWERTALWVVSLACILCSLAWLLAPAPASAPPSPGGPRRRASILGSRSGAFLTPDHSLPQTGSTFGFSYELPEAPSVTVQSDPVPQGDPVPDSGTEQTTGTGKGTGIVEQGGGATDTLPPEDPPVPATTRSVRYLGTYEGTAGQRLAALAVRNPKTGTVQTRFLRPGQTCGEFRVDSFDAKSLRVLAPDGTRATVPRGAEQTVTMH